MKQYEAVIETLKKLGGIATLGQLNQEVFKIVDCEWKTKTPFASIRRIVQQTPNEIYKIKPGLYGLVSCKNQLEKNGYIVETELNKDSKEVQEFSHSYYQGILLTVGNLKHMDTFSPNQDKNRKFINQTLGEIRSLSVIPKFSYEKFVQRSSTIDAIWFNKRMMPDSFFEVEHSTDISNSLEKYNDLQDFNVRMIIVADKKRREEFNVKYQRSSFDNIRNRVSFLDYESLNRQYEREVEAQTFEIIL
ncbi:MAG: hypothetical protein PHV24_02340 [Candidatus Kapabacteria bacterium]|nr:hypothetical protein [Candidatus Kapabacteria bacterium]